jgi:hypothetical protein
LNHRGREESATGLNLSVFVFALLMKKNSDQSDVNGKEEGKNIIEDGSSESLKTNSLVVDDFPDFDADSLEVEDDWNDVFDDEDESCTFDSSALGTSRKDDNDSKLSCDESTTDSINSSALMPPPPPLKDTTPQGSTSTTTTTTATKSTSNMPTTFSSVPGMDSLATNRRPLDHSITRRIKTAGTVDRRDSAPPSWHSDAADLPHRQAMVQDM